MDAPKNPKTDRARTLLDDYLKRTGIAGSGGDRSRRYLWTDAFAVQACFGIAEELGDSDYKNHALRLIDTVHEVLGRHRPDDSEGRVGRISGLPEEEGARHPTLRGLRIGKPQPERLPTDPADERLEWQQDGQYFHYLTRWVRALLRALRETEKIDYGVWAAELMEASRAFVVGQDSGLRMHWKMSIDLSRPLVPSMGAHDPLDGLLCVDAVRKDVPGQNARLAKLQHDFQTLCEGRNWATPDPLGIGGLLLDLSNLCVRKSAGDAPPPPLDLENLMAESFQSLAAFHASHHPGRSAEQRLAFRECGLSLGIRTFEACVRAGVAGDVSEEEIADEIKLAEELESFWSEPSWQNVRIWTEHEDINAVTLASSLVASRRPWAFTERVPPEA